MSRSRDCQLSLADLCNSLLDGEDRLEVSVRVVSVLSRRRNDEFGGNFLEGKIDNKSKKPKHFQVRVGPLQFNPNVNTNLIVENGPASGIISENFPLEKIILTTMLDLMMGVKG